MKVEKYNIITNEVKTIYESENIQFSEHELHMGNTHITLNGGIYAFREIKGGDEDGVQERQRQEEISN